MDSIAKARGSGAYNFTRTREIGQYFRS